jgi:hypothetical protein
MWENYEIKAKKKDIRQILEKKMITTKQCSNCLCTSRKAMIHLGRSYSVIFSFSLATA